MSQKWSHPSVLKLLKEYSATDPISLIKEICRDFVSKAFDQGWEGPPFNPIELAQIKGMDILPNDGIIEARIIPVTNNKFRIEYNSSIRPSRVNFSISHEIAHTLFSDCSETVRYRMSSREEPNAWELELLCNIAAAEILLPYIVFSADTKTPPSSIQDFIQLSEKYDASLEAVLLRYAEITQQPCATILSAFSDPEFKKLQVLYSKFSNEFHHEINRGYIIPHHSKAYECVNPGWTAEGFEYWSVLGNKKYAFHSVGLPPLRNDSRLRVATLILPEENLTHENTINYVLGDATLPRGGGNKIIAQVVNSGAALGAGFGRAIAKKWPNCSYALKRWKQDHKNFELGNSQLIELDNNLFVFQMLAQKGVSPNQRSIGLQYFSLRHCLIKLAETSLKLKASVHMPRIGAGQARGNWSIIEGMINEELISKGIPVTVYDLPGSKLPRNEQSDLLFS